ncbi:pilus assembly FimT family protein [Aliivibrio wodanis]|uniref:pilus assembly FimT family protein n=1 Tax=Aliivibrio wodanis TaxID=80852 RepID=UPI00406CA78C
MKLKGFTLLELLITIFVISITLVIGLPNFTKLLSSAEQDRLQKELVGLFIQAKSEAVLKNKDVYIHFHKLTNGYSEANDWCVVLTTKEKISSCNESNGAITKLHSASFPRIKIKRTEEYEALSFDPVRAMPKFKNDEEFVDVLAFYSQDKNKVTALRSHFMGRIGIYIY